MSRLRRVRYLSGTIRSRYSLQLPGRCVRQWVAPSTLSCLLRQTSKIRPLGTDTDPVRQFLAADLLSSSSVRVALRFYFVRARPWERPYLRRTYLLEQPNSSFSLVIQQCPDETTVGSPDYGRPIWPNGPNSENQNSHQRKPPSAKKAIS
jgi:hypothetical protein